MHLERPIGVHGEHGTALDLALDLAVVGRTENGPDAAALGDGDALAGRLVATDEQLKAVVVEEPGDGLLGDEFAGVALEVPVDVHALVAERLDAILWLDGLVPRAEGLQLVDRYGVAPEQVDQQLVLLVADGEPDRLDLRERAQPCGDAAVHAEQPSRDDTRERQVVTSG